MILSSARARYLQYRSLPRAPHLPIRFEIVHLPSNRESPSESNASAESVVLAGGGASARAAGAIGTGEHGRFVRTKSPYHSTGLSPGPEQLHHAREHSSSPRATTGRRAASARAAFYTRAPPTGQSAPTSPRARAALCARSRSERAGARGCVRERARACGRRARSFCPFADST